MAGSGARFPLIMYETSELNPTVIATVIAVVTAFVYYSLYAGPLGSIPGPLLARSSKLWLIYHSRKGDMHRATIALHEKYGPIVRTGPNEVSISDPAAIKKVYGRFDSRSISQQDQNSDESFRSGVEIPEKRLV